MRVTPIVACGFSSCFRDLRQRVLEILHLAVAAAAAAGVVVVVFAAAAAVAGAVAALDVAVAVAVAAVVVVVAAASAAAVVVRPQAPHAKLSPTPWSTLNLSGRSRAKPQGPASARSSRWVFCSSYHFLLLVVLYYTMLYTVRYTILYSMLVVYYIHSYDVEAVVT